MLRSTSNFSTLCAKHNKTALNKRLNSTASIAIQNGVDIDFAPTKTTAKPRRITWEEAKPLNMMPGPKPLPILGNTWRFTHGEFKGLDTGGLYKSLYKTYGKISRLRGVIGLNDTVVMFDPNDVQEMYLHEGAWPERKILKVVTHYRKVMRKELFQEVYGLPVSQGQEWFKIRSAVNPILLQPRISEEFMPKIETAAREFVRRIAKFAAINPQMPDNFIDEINKYTLESVSYVTLNKRFGLLNDELTEDTKKIIHYTTRVFELIYELDMQPSIWKIYPTKKWREFIELMDYLTAMYLSIIDEEVKRLMDTTHFKTAEDRCILEKFLEIDKRIAITVVFDTLAAGVDTTSKTVGAMMYLLARHTRVQKKLRKELMEVFPDPDTPITPELLKQCKYLRAVVKESSRVHGVAIAQLRTATKDHVLGGYQIPKGVDLVAAQVIMAKSEEFVNRAKEFIPERFLRESANEKFSMANVNKHIYLPFGFGPRSCVGKRLATLELEISLALIVRKFRLDWHHEKMKFRATIMYGLTDPLKVHVTPVEEGPQDHPNEDLDTLPYAPELD